MSTDDDDDDFFLFPFLLFHDDECHREKKIRDCHRILSLVFDKYILFASMFPLCLSSQSSFFVIHILFDVFSFF